MLIGLAIVGLLAAIWFAAALIPVVRLGVTFRQGLLYAPLKLVYGIDERQMVLANKSRTPVIYAVIHRSKLDPALMLTLLPDHTLHILDQYSASAAWLEPFRALAPTIAFNAEHVFVSRRLVRRLKGSGRLAVYIPDDVEPDPKSFRLYRAIARIASQADARIVPIDIVNARRSPFSLTPSSKVARQRFPCLTIRALEGLTIAQLAERTGENRTTRAHAFFDRLAEQRIVSANPGRSLFRALRDAAVMHGARRMAVQDSLSGPKSYRRLFTEARIIGRHVQGKTVGANEAVGIYLPNSALMVSAFLAIQSAGRLAALIDPSRPAGEMTSHLQILGARIVLSSRSFAEDEKHAPMIAAMEAGGIKLVWIEEILAGTGRAGWFAAKLARRRALVRRHPDDPAIALAAELSDGGPETVIFSQRNILANILQLKTRIEISMADTVFNMLPAHDCSGLSGGTLLSMMAGARLYLDPTLAAGKDMPNVPSGIRPTILIGTETLFARIAQHGPGNLDLSRLRTVFAGAEPVTHETRRIFRERYGVEILEGYGVGEAAPVVALNSATHSREGTVGRLLPGIRMRLEPFGDAFRLWLSGPSLMRWVVRPDQPARLLPVDEWQNTGDLVTVDREGFLTLRGRAEAKLEAKAQAKEEREKGKSTAA